MARITYRKTRRGETITMRADKGEDLRGAIEAMAKPVPKRIVHLADKLGPNGEASALCFDPPRAIDMKRATWSTDASAVTCEKCKRARAAEVKP